MFKRLLRLCFSRPAWEALAAWRFRASETWALCQTLAPPFGLFSAVKLWLGEQLGRPGRDGLRRVWPAGFRSPICYRPRSSDLGVLSQVFGRCEYAAVSAESDIRLILDCGANIGCTSLYFLHRYPQAHLIAVEPDAENFRICERNLAPFADRVTLIQAGVWSSEGPLKVVRGTFRDGMEWSHQVRPALADEQADCHAITVEALLTLAGMPRVDVLKIDIEGAEEELFSADCDTWLRRTRHLVIELHGQACEHAFERALDGYEFRAERSGELLVCRELTAPPQRRCAPCLS